MSPETSLTKRDHALLIGDGFMLTAATMAMAIGITLGLYVAAGSPGDTVYWALLNVTLMAAGGIAGVIAAWMLHGRRITGAASVGGLLGVVASSVVMPAFVFVAYLLGLLASIFTAWEFAGPLAAAVVFGAAAVALMVWLLVDAMRDLAPSRRTHFRLDLARIGAALALVVLAVIVIVMAMQPDGAETAEAIIFALIAGVGGALMVAGADAATLYAQRQKDAQTPAAPA